MISACDTPPDPQTGLVVSGAVSSDAWVADLALIVTVETNESALDAELNVYAAPPYETCPPSVQAEPTALSAWTLAVPAGFIVVIDGAAETARAYDKAAKIWTPGDRYVSHAQLWSDLPVWPTVPGPCDSVCAVVAAATPEDDPTVTIEVVERHA